MCGIVGFIDKLGRQDLATGAIVLGMLEALGCRGPDSAGIALLHDSAQPGLDGIWGVRAAPLDAARAVLGAAVQVAPVGGLRVFKEPATHEGLERLGKLTGSQEQGDTIRLSFLPHPGVTVDDVERTLGAARGGLELLCLGERLDLVKQVGSPAELEATYGVSAWRGPLAIGHTRLSTESRIDLIHSQPFWAHGVPDLATVHNGHVTNYHQLRRHYEQEGRVFYTDNDSEVIGVYLRDRLEQGQTLPEALDDSLTDLDGAYNYLVVSPEGLGVVRDRFGFKPLVVAETDEFVAVATEEVALRRALPGDYRVVEPPPGHASFYPLLAAAMV
jgi:glutamine phosphoribosylpyrophosphate amidotransferase